MVRAPEIFEDSHSHPGFDRAKGVTPSAPSPRLVWQRWERRRMTRKALARRIADSYLTSQQRGQAPAPPQPGGLCGFWPSALLLVGQRPLRVFSLLASRTRPKSAAALLYEPRTWCTTSLRTQTSPAIPAKFARKNSN